MPISTIHVLEGRYDERRLRKVSAGVRDALIRVQKVTADDVFQIIHELPRHRFIHTPSYLGMKYSDDFILLEVASVSGLPKETRLAMLKELNARIVAEAGIPPDDLMVHLSQDPAENYSFGQATSAKRRMASCQTDADMRLAGKTALITGGNSGIGLATAKQFVDEGAYVYITGTKLFVDGGFAQV